MYGHPVHRVQPEAPVASIMSWPVAVVDPDAALPAVAEALAADEVGAVGVLERGDLVGIVSERDLVAHLASGSDPSRLTAREVMSQDLVTITPETTVVEAARVMCQAEVRHLPVLSDGLIAGIVSVRDLVEVLLRHAEQRPAAF